MVQKRGSRLGKKKEPPETPKKKPSVEYDPLRDTEQMIDAAIRAVLNPESP